MRWLVRWFVRRSPLPGVRGVAVLPGDVRWAHTTPTPNPVESRVGDVRTSGGHETLSSPGRAGRCVCDPGYCWPVRSSSLALSSTSPTTPRRRGTRVRRTHRLTVTGRFSGGSSGSRLIRGSVFFLKPYPPATGSQNVPANSTISLTFSSSVTLHASSHSHSFAEHCRHMGADERHHAHLRTRLPAHSRCRKRW